MTLQECYALLEGDYESAAHRLMTETLVRKFVFKFLDDGSFDLLKSSLKNGNYEDAFRAAHTIKGVCQNLSFTKLYESGNALTEALRGREDKDYSELFKAVEEDYNMTVSAIKKLQAES